MDPSLVTARALAAVQAITVRTQTTKASDRIVSCRELRWLLAA
jgi:hypothetical protein